MTAVLDFDSTSRTMGGEYELHYHEAGSGPVLLMLHGSGPGVSGWSNFAGNFPVFAEHFRTIVLDMPGFGRSPAREWNDVYPRVAADAIRYFLDELDIDSVDIVGNSMGGNVGTEFALAHPERVRRMVLMGPGGLAVNSFAPPVSEGSRRLFEFLANPTREGMVAWVDTMVGNPAVVTDELIDQRLANALAPGAIANTFKIFQTFSDPRFADRPQLWARAAQVRQETLLVWRRDDRMLPYEGSLFPFRQMPNAELHVFSRCGHWAQIERKADFERLTLEFLGR
ncbi:alpha/beta fold hydrolase [Rhodococcus sp. NPDC127528]|uniref:alpha/beta fold hydrolase n=1 Tax=unclassified Rhodococcus (in: high G+C Gram-positive bacteria) TaxID=192944 RepID=UPI00362F9701